MNTLKKTSSIIIAVIILILSLSLIGCGSSPDTEDYLGVEIEFPKTTDGDLDHNALLEYNVTELNAQLSKDKTYYISGKPVLTDYAVVQKFGFSADDYIVHDDGERTYSAEGKDKEKFLNIEPDGSFLYKTGIKGTTFAITLTDKECYDIAKKFLQDNGLFLEEFGTTASVSEAEGLGSASEGFRVTALGVSFLAVGEYNKSYATVTINGNGEITAVSYNAPQYSQHRKVNLISIEKAIERIKQNKALIDVGELYSYTELKIENISVSYYEHEVGDDSVLVQPVYLFNGTVTATDGSTQPFTITVQANQYE